MGSILVAAVDRVGDQISRITGRPPRARCVVLAYHSVTDRQRAQFAAQMDILARDATPVPSDIEALPNATGQHFAAVTFDDGLNNFLDNALPELRQRRIPTTLFIVTDALGCNPAWEHFSGDDPSQEGTLTEQQLKELPSDLISIGSHTMTHPMLPKVNDEHLKQELMGSRSKLERMLNRRITQFSFPYGAFDDRVIDSCREAGYDRAFTALPVLAFTEPREFLTGRVGTSPNDWPIEFRLKLAGAYRWLPYAYALKRKIISALRRGATPPRLSAEQKKVA